MKLDVRFWGKGIKQVTGRLTKKDWWYLALTAVLCAGFALAAYTSTSPLYPHCYGVDSSFFMFTGRMVRDGKVPYLDFFDMKGPLIFFIQALGQWICDGKMGIFLVQIIFLMVSMWLAYGIARQFVREAPAFLIVILNLLVLWATCTGGNLTEEFSLPPVLLSCLLAAVYVRSGKGEHPPLYAGVYGACFACLALIRVTNAAFICGIIGSVLVVLVRGKRWKNLVWNMGGFLLGAGLCFLPVAAYFLAHGAFREMIYGTFQFPFLYSNDGVSGRSASTWMSLFYYISPVLFGFLGALIYGRKKEAYMGYLMAFAGFLTLVALGMGQTSDHYFTMGVPIYTVGLSMVWRLLSEKDTRQRPWPLFLTAALVSVSLTGFIHYQGRISDSISYSLSYILDPHEEAEEEERLCREQGAMIPQAERDSVWGYDLDPRWYYINNIQPCFRYCAYIPIFVKLNPEETVAEIYEMLDTVFPRWIVAPELEEVDLEYLRAVLETRYELVDHGDSADLYRLKQ